MWSQQPPDPRQQLAEVLAGLRAAHTELGDTREEQPKRELERSLEAAAGASHTAGVTRRLAAGLDKLAEAQRAAGGLLAEAFADYALSKDLDEDLRGVAELFVAWREVGEAQVSLAGQLGGLCRSLREQAAHCESEAALRGREARRLLDELADVRAPQGGGLLRWMFGRSLTLEEEEAERGRRETQTVAISTCLEQIAENMDAIREHCRASLTTGLAEGRRQAKAVGERMSTLRPSWRGCAETRRRPAQAAAAAASAPPSAASSASRPQQKADMLGGGKVDQMIRTIATADSRQKALDAESAAEERLAAKQGRTGVAEPEPPMMAPPVESVGESEWRIRGVYDHQVLKAGLRLLEEAWRLEGSGDFPRGRDGGSVMLREGLLRDLLTGKIRLQSVPNSDVAAAQNDVKRLSLPQLLKLRVLHLDFVPSGCGADTVHSVGGTQEAFLALLDGLLFQQLGRRAAGALLGGAAAPGDDPEEAWHRLGREAVLLRAAASAVTASRWWCWWLTDSRRAYFDAAAFACSASFPDAGALEVTDLSKPDKHDPSGRLRWMDWRISLVADEASVAPGPCSGARPQARKDQKTKEALEALRQDLEASMDESTDAAAEPQVGARGGPHGGGGPRAEADGAGSEAPSGAAGAATAGLVSPEVLRGLRGSLRSTAPVRSGGKQAAPAGGGGEETPAGDRPD